LEIIQIVLLSPPSTYPLPLLSLTTHLALLSCRLPALTSSSRDDDPIFNDDWDAALPLYPFIPVSSSTSSQPRNQKRRSNPPVTLLVISVGENIFFDPSSEELAVADAVVAISVGQSSTIDPNEKQPRLKLLALRTIDPPSRQFAAATATEGGGTNKEGEGDGVWRKRMGGMKRGLVGRMIKMVLEGGVGAEIFHGLENWT
jgi:exosome complex component RRP42